MLTRIIGLLVILLIFSQSSFAGTKQGMRKVFKLMKEVLVMSNDELSFHNQKNRKDAKRNLEKIFNTFRSHHLNNLNYGQFSIPKQTFQEQIEESIMGLNSDDYPYTRLKINNLTSLCISCHSQLPKNKSFSHVKIDEKDFSNKLLLGKMYLITRKFDKSYDVYSSVMSDQLQKMKKLNRSGVANINRLYFGDTKFHESLSMILLMGIKFNLDINGTISLLENLKKNSPINDLALAQYLKRLKYWLPKEDDLKSMDKDMIKELMDFAQNKLSLELTNNETVVDLLILTGFFSKALYQSKLNKDQKSHVYLYLGIGENYLNRNLFYSMGDLYLEACLNDWNAKYQLYKKCFDTYKEEVYFRFSGSRGTDIPKYYQSKLDYFSGKLEEKKKASGAEEMDPMPEDKPNSDEKVEKSESQVKAEEEKEEKKSKTFFFF